MLVVEQKRDNGVCTQGFSQLLTMLSHCLKLRETVSPGTEETYHL